MKLIATTKILQSDVIGVGTMRHSAKSVAQFMDEPLKVLTDYNR